MRRHSALLAVLRFGGERPIACSRTACHRQDMADEPIAEAFFTEGYASICDVAVGDFVVGRRISTKYKDPGWYIPIGQTFRACGGWPRPFWQVGSLEGLKASKYNTSCTGMVLLQRFEPWQSLGPNGLRIVAIFDRLEGFDAAELERVRSLLGRPESAPVISADITVPYGLGGDPLYEVRDRVVAAAERLDPGAVVDRAWENGYQGDPRSLESPLWLDLQTIAADAARALFVEELDFETVASLEHRFWRLLPSTVAAEIEHQ